MLLKVEAALLAGEVPPWTHAVLLEIVRHMLRCHSSGPLKASRSSERRHPRRRSTSKPAGHGRIGADAYERQVLRCAACQEIFAAPLPATATGSKYHPSVGAVLAVARYGLGLPHHRLAQWQAWAGIPLPASTQPP